MTPPFPFPPLSYEELKAIETLERTTTFQRVEDAYDLVRKATLRRTFASALIALPLGAIAALTVSIALGLGRSGQFSAEPFIFALLFAWLFTPAAQFLIRGPRPAMEEKRMRDALKTAQALKRAEQAT